MLKRAKVGLIIWGAILSVILLILIAVAVEAGDDMGEAGGAVIIVLVFLLLGAAAMIVLGIVNAVKTSQYNRQLLSQNILYDGFCPYCGTRINATIKDFRPHGRYPEGYINCMVCKKPISRNVFQEIRQGSDNAVYR